MRIAHVLPQLALGGAERVTVELARHAAVSGNDVVLVLGTCGPDEGPLRARLPSNVRVEYVAPKGASRSELYGRTPGWIISRRSWLESLDILHCHLSFGAYVGTLVGGVRALRRSRRPVIVETYHAVGMNVPTPTRWFHAAMARQRDALVLMATEDPYWRSFAARHPAACVRTILNGAVEPSIADLDLDARLEYRRKIGIPDACELVVGTVGQLRADRQPWLYIPIFAELSRRLGSAVHFVVSGGGPEYDRLTSLVAQHGLDGRVHFTGAVSEPKYPLAVLDLYLTVNVGSVTGVAAIEAALGGIPVLAVQLTEGYVTQPQDWIWSSTSGTAVADRALEVLQDPEMRRDMADRQRHYAHRRHSADFMACAYEALYEELLSRNSAAR